MVQSNFTCPRSCIEAGDRFCRFRPLTDSLGPVKVCSHVAKIDVDVRSLDALELACKALGLELRRGQKSYRWYGRNMGDYPLPPGITVDQLGRCDHAISIPGNHSAYEVGVVARKDGSGFDLLWDFWDGGKGLEAIVGENCANLSKEYATAVIEHQAQQLGWLCERTQDGALVVYHPEGGTLTYAQGEIATAGFTGQGCHEARLQLGLDRLGLSASEIQGTQEGTAVAAMVQIPR